MNESPTSPESAHGATYRQFGRPSQRLTVATIRDIASQMGSARLFFDLGEYGPCSDLAEDAQRRLRELADRMELPEPERSWRWISRIAAAVTVTILLALVAVLALATPAHAAENAASSSPRQIVVDQPVEHFTLTTTASGQAGGVHGASIYIGYPGDSRFTYAGSGTSSTTTVRIPALLDARRISVWGHMDAQVVDDTTGQVRPIQLDVRRRSVAMLNHADLRFGGTVTLGARVTHYSVAQHGYVSSRLSPVRFEELTPGGWTTIATGTTNADGLAGAIVRAQPGAHRYRVVRPAGATVTAATSSSREVTGLGC